MAKRDIPEINAGSMADIAFLLLIFFLVTTTMDVDEGISRRLPEKQQENQPKPPIVKMRNVLEINVNRNNEILVEGKDYVQIKDLKQIAKDFIDNGGGEGKDGNKCNYCGGAKSTESSDHPNKAIIFLQSDRSTDYGTFIAIQNELTAAYTELRNVAAKSKFNMSYEDLVLLKENSKTKSDTEKDAIDVKIKEIKKMYPEIISEAEPTK